MTVRFHEPDRVGAKAHANSQNTGEVSRILSKQPLMKDTRDMLQASMGKRHNYYL